MRVAATVLADAKVVGAVFSTTAGLIRAEVLFDELHVTVTTWDEA